MTRIAIRKFPCKLLVAVILLPWTSGCNRSGGILLSIQVRLLAFMQSQNDEVPNGHIYDFPTLEAYDHSGRLMYLSHDATANAKLLQSLPESLNHLTAIANQSELDQTLKRLPGLSEHDKHSLLANHVPTVLDFTLEECEACTLQENALNLETAKNLTAHGLNVLLIRVLR